MITLKYLYHDNGNCRIYYRCLQTKRLYCSVSYFSDDTPEWYLCSKDGEPQCVITFKNGYNLIE